MSPTLPFMRTPSSGKRGVNTSRPRQNCRHFPDDILKWIFLDEDVIISIKLSLKFVPKGSINNNSALVLIMAWRRPGDKPISEPMLVRSLTHICVTRPQWVKQSIGNAREVHPFHHAVIFLMWNLLRAPDSKNPGRPHVGPKNLAIRCPFHTRQWIE